MRAGPALAIVALAGVTLALGDVPPLTIAVYAAGLVGFVLAPGIALYRALTTAPGSLLRQLAFGWATGEAILIGAYVLAGVLGLRDVFWLVPPAVLVLALPFARRRPLVDESGPTSAQAWALAGIVSAFVVSAAAVRFPGAPLLGSLGPSANWDKDTVYFLSLAAEAKWHWPPADPNVAGLPLYYHYLSFVELGAMSRLTGIELSDLMLRFDVVAPNVLAGLLVAVAGRALSGRWSVGVIAVALVLVMGELDLDPLTDKTFRGRFAELARDTSFHYGLLFGLPALVLMAERLGLAARPRPAPGAGDWVLLAVLIGAAAGSKLPVAEVLLGGTGLFVALAVVRRRPVGGTAWQVLGLTAAGFLAALVLAYPRDSVDTGLSLRAGAIFDKMALLQEAGLRGPELMLPAVLAWPLGAIVGSLGLLTPVAVGLFLGARVGDGLDRRLRELLLSVFAAGFLATVAFAHGGNSEEYFLWYGYPAAALVAAAGFDRFLRERVESVHARRSFVLALAAALVAGLVVALALPGMQTPPPPWFGWLPEAFAGHGSSVGLLALVLGATALACLAVAPAAHRPGEPAPRRLVPMLATAVLLGTLVLASADRVVPRVLPTVLDGTYGEIGTWEIRIAFVVWVLAAGAGAGFAWWLARRRYAGRIRLSSARLALLALGACVVVLAPEHEARVPLAGVLTGLQPVLIMPIVLALALVAAPALARPNMGGGARASVQLARERLRAAAARLLAQPRRAAWLAAGCVATGIAAALVTSALAGRHWHGRLDMTTLAVMAACVLSALGFLAVARRWSAERSLAAPLALAAILAPSMLDLTLDVAAPAYQRARGDAPNANDPDPRLLTPGIAAAMRWLRGHSGVDDVLIVNNHYQNVARRDPRYFFYAALAERRTYLGGWDYSGISPQGGGPPSARLSSRQRTNRAALCGDRRTLAALARSHGVRWIVIDKVHGGGAARPVGLSRAFANADVDVYRLPAGRMPAGADATPCAVR